MRLASCHVIEAAMAWLAAQEAAQAVREHTTALLEQRERRRKKEARRGEKIAIAKIQRAGVGAGGAHVASAISIASVGAHSGSSEGACEGASAGRLERASSRGDGGGGGGGDLAHTLEARTRAPPPPNIFSQYSLRFACTPPTESSRTRESPGLWDGLNYLLKMGTDVCRLPLPTMSDPFFLRWFKGTEFDAELTNSRSDVRRMMAAETAFKRLFTREQSLAIEAIESTVALRLRRVPLEGGGEGGEGEGMGTPLPSAGLESAAEAVNWKVLVAARLGWPL